ncbi:DNA mismatch repair endonuclease MutL [Alphaproteobacteria bacterium]|nr:DNA mismatch repair endonuclease MutL [Alphaproteobacteria bacterium]
MKINFLSSNIINQIAAGEVVERPANVIKELVENSIDASAKNISIAIDGGGIEKIVVSDDGLGIYSDQLHIALSRHATSKLKDDLSSIKYHGFRGEALPSIASVSKFLITSRVEKEEEGWSLRADGGTIQKPYPDSIRKGTRIEVSDLFYLTPARLKFLKTQRVEVQLIFEVVKRLSIAYPQIGFSLVSDGKVKLSFPSSKENFFSRIGSVLGKEFIDNSIEIEGVRNDAKITGLVCLPTYNKNTSKNNYIYVNGRYVIDRKLIGALRGAYRGFMSSNRFPVSVLNINIPSSNVDVNVHPHKTEVRFLDESNIKSLIVKSVSNALSDIGIKNSETTSTTALNAFEKFNSVNLGNQLLSNSKNDNINVEFKDNLNSTIEKSIFKPNAKTHKAEVIDEDFPLGSAVAQIYNTYIISQTKSGMIVTDQHAAHERIILEKIKLQLKQKEVKTQVLLIPEVIELNEMLIELLIEHSEQFKKLGLCFESFGAGSLIVREIPAILGEVNVFNLIQDLAENILDSENGSTLVNTLEEVCSSMACHTSIRAGRKLDIKEMNALLRTMELTPNSGQCNHGRPTYIKLNKTDIEKLFGRI